jgi:hypothetical protein
MDRWSHRRQPRAVQGRTTPEESDTLMSAAPRGRGHAPRDAAMTSNHPLGRAHTPQPANERRGDFSKTATSGSRRYLPIAPYPRSQGPKTSRLGTLAVEASGFLVGPAVFNTDEGATSPLAGSIPVRLRHV